jgi:uncharacterized protein (TIGR02271 family)
MLNRKMFQEKYPQFVDGMPVRSTDDENLGKVTLCDDTGFIVEKGIFFPKDFSARYDDIQDVRDGVIYLRHDQGALSNWKDKSYQGWGEVDGMNNNELAGGSTGRMESVAAGEKDIRVPVMEEELEARKTVRENGNVRVRKVVHTEYKHLTVPVMKEELEIERVPLSDAQASGEGLVAGAFKEETLNIPLREEEVEVTKRTVAKEEVRLTKTQKIEERDVSGEIRKEEVEIDRDSINRDDLNRRKAG